MKKSKFFLGGTALLLTVASVYATKVAKSSKHVTGWTKTTGSCRSRHGSVVLTGTKSINNDVKLHTSSSLTQTVFTSSSCNTPYYTVSDNG